MGSYWKDLESAYDQSVPLATKFITSEDDLTFLQFPRASDYYRSQPIIS